MPSVDRTTPSIPTVAVIGGGFSGLLTAIHLLQADRDLVVRLVERAPQFGRGRAYGAENPDHLLNVRVSNMSALPDQPEHFAEWLRDHGDKVGPDAFVRRGRYGDYLQSLLRDHVGDPDNAGRLLLEQDEAVDLEPSDGGCRVRLSLGRSFDADAVVLAVGSPGAPSSPAFAEADVAAAPHYFANPWALDRAAVPSGNILVLGSGLTMVDTALSLAGVDRRLVALSRHGLLPRMHAPAATVPQPDGPVDTPARALRTLRAHARVVGWREAVDSIRPQTVAIWSAWSLGDRRRFLRHAQTWWDVHRHRMAPAVAAQVTDLVASGGLEVVGAQIERIRLADGGFEVSFRRLTDGHWITQRFDAVINCTGLRGAPSPDDDSLVGRLARRGLVRGDPLGLGLQVTAGLQVIGSSGAATQGLFAVGPLTREAFWEAIAVPDLRVHTALVAAAVIESLRVPEAA